MDIKPFLMGLPLGPISGVASILYGAEQSRRAAEEERVARELEERRKVEMKEVEGYAAKGNHAMLQQAYDSGMYTSLPQDFRDRSLFRAGTFANQQIALDAETAAKAGFQPYFGTPQQMQQAMTMIGQPGAPQGMTPTPQPPPMLAQQAQAALPAGAPGQLTSAMEMGPPINAPMSPGAVQTQEALGQRSGPQFGEFGMPPALNKQVPSPMPPAARVEGSPNPMQYGPQYDYQGKPLPQSAPSTLPYNADAPQHITEEPIVMAERKQFGPSATAPQPTGLQWPKLTRPGHAAIEGPLGTVPGKSESTISSGTLTTTMLGQAAKLNMPPAEFERLYQEEAIKRKGDLPELDHQQLTDYRDRYFGRRTQQITAEIQSTSAGQAMDPALIQQAAARAASREMGNYIPTKGGEAIGFTPEERHLSAINQATGAMARELETAIRITEAGGKYKPDFGQSFVDIIDNSPSMTPEQKTHVKQQAAAQIAARLDQKLPIPGDTFGMIKNKMLAASMTGGAVPHDWMQQVAADPKSWGMSQAMADKYLSDPQKYSPFSPGGYDRLANAVADNATQGKLFDRALADPTHAEVYANASERMKQQPMAGPGAPSTQSPLAGMGAQTRAIDVQQREAESAAGVKGTKVEERHQVIESVAQPLSDLAKSMKRYMDIPLTNITDSSNAAKLYSSQLKTMRSILAKGVLLQSGALNEQEQEAAMGALSGLIEAKAFPDVADEKIATLNRLMTKAFGKPVDLLADDPLNPQATPALKFDRQGNPIGQPSMSPPPPPPIPQPTPGMPQTAPAQMMPMSAPQPAPAPQATPTPTPTASPAQPPISSAVEAAKRANPSEAAPKFGPGSTKAAASTVPPEVQQAMTPQDKSALATAMQKYSRGQLDDRQLELEVAKVLMRAGGKKLEGQTLNKAVTAWTEVLRRGAKSKKEFASGQ